MIRHLFASFICTVFMLSPVAGTAAEDLPADIPSNFPLPADADPKVKTNESAVYKRVIVTYSFSGKPAALYKRYRKYAVDGGYSITKEDEEDYDFKAKRSALDTLSVGISDMSHVNAVTVTLMLPNK